MNRDDLFEQRLRRQPFRRVPAAWREKILVAADVNRRTAPVRELTFAATMKLRLRELFWPAPKAWAGLAAVWLAILALNFAARGQSPTLEARRATPQSPQMRELLRQQEQLLAELVGPTEKPETDRPKPAVPQPRSQCDTDYLNA